MKKIKIEFKQLHNNAILPKYAHIGDSGMDVFANNVKLEGKTILLDDMHDKIFYINPMETVAIGVGFAAKIPLGYEIQIRPTSGNSLKTSLRIANSPATNDACYRGEIDVLCTNLSTTDPLPISKDAKIAQLVLNEVPLGDIELVEEFSEDEYENTRGEKGFGSTGIVTDKFNEVKEEKTIDDIDKVLNKKEKLLFKELVENGNNTTILEELYVLRILRNNFIKDDDYIEKLNLTSIETIDKFIDEFVFNDSIYNDIYNQIKFEVIRKLVSKAVEPYDLDADLLKYSSISK